MRRFGRPPLGNIDEWIRYSVQRVAGEFCLRGPFAAEAESEA
jgi:hypothetical protein